MQKFEKIGLTESITEPIAPKTLLYKVKLLLRSIKIASEEDEEYNSKTFGKDGTEEEGSEKKVRKAKEDIDDGEAMDYLTGKTEKKADVELDLDEPRKSNFQEEEIDGS